jgi:TolA-binding protein
MRRRILSAAITFCLLIGGYVYAQDDKGKELSKDWDSALAAYKSAPSAPETIQKLNNFSDRWKDSNKYEAARAKYLTAMIYFKGAQYQQSMDAFKSVVDNFSSSPYADSSMYRMGECLYNMGKFSDAIDQWSSFRSKYSNSLFNMEAIYGTSLAWLNLKEYKKADRELSDFLAGNKFYAEDENIKLIGGIIDFYLERYDNSVTKLKKLKSDTAYYYGALSLVKLSRFLDAANSFKQIMDNYKGSKYSESALYNKAESFYKGENFPVAAADYKSFIAQFPSSQLVPYAQLKLGSCIFNDKMYKDAAKAYDAVIGGNGDKRVKAYAQYLEGECFRKLADFSSALKSYQKVTDNYPDIYDAVASAQLRTGWCDLNLNKSEDANTILTSFVGKFRTHDDIAVGYYLLGNSNFNIKKYDAALEDYRYIMEKFKYSNISEAALLMMALSYYKEGQFDMLANEISHSIDLLSTNFKDPDSKNLRARTYFYLGQAYYKSKIYGPAAKAFKAILDDYYESDITNEARANLAWCYYELENYQGARTMARDVVNSTISDANVKKACEILIAHSYFSEKDYDKAIAAYQQFAYAHKADKDSELTAEALFQQGKANEVKEVYGDALEAYKTVVALYPKSKRAAESAYKMSDIYFKAQDYVKAIDGFTMVMKKYADSEFAEDAMLSIAEVQYNSGNEAGAVKGYQDFLKKYPDSKKIKNVEEGMERAMYVKAEKKSDPEMMLEFYNKYPDSNLAINAVYSAAELYYKASKFEKAIESFNKVIQQFPNDSMAINANYYIAACYAELKKNDEAIAAYKAFVKNYPKHELAPEVTFNLATTDFSSKNYPEAIFYYARIIEKYPESQYALNALYNSALAYTELGKTDDAIKTYKDFMLKYPKDDKSKGLNAYIASIYFDKKRYNEALIAYEDLYTNGNDDEKVQALYTMGNIYGTLENMAKLIEIYNRLIDVKPPDNVYRLNGLVDLASKYEEKQDWKNAVRIYDIIKVSGGSKEYVDFATSRVPTIMQAYPDVFKEGAVAAPDANTNNAQSKSK